MRDYELALIVNPEVADEDVEGVIGRVRGYIEAGKGEILDVNVWGRRRIAFPIKHHRFGTYAIITMKADPSAIRELERSLDLYENILRHMVIKLERPPVIKPAAQPAQPEQPVAVEQPAAAEEQSNDGGDTQ